MSDEEFQDKSKETLKEILNVLRIRSVDVKEASEQQIQDSIEKVLESALLKMGKKE